MTIHSRFTGQPAPCGRAVDGNQVLDDDEQGFVFEHLIWDCGCQSTRRQYHDGSVERRVVDHRGKVRLQEHSSMHEG
jgi:hypothetical protein